MSSILKGLNESYFSPSERDQQNAMDTRRRSDLSGERNAGLNEPDELPTTPQQSRNGVYEYNVPTGQEKIAQKLGLELHKGHWFSRIPVQRANFQFGRPQFHEIPPKNVSEAEQDYGPEYQDKVQRLGQMAKQGERKTVWDPVKRVYKTVPVNPPKDQGVAETKAHSTNHKVTWMSNSANKAEHFDSAGAAKAKVAALKQSGQYHNIKYTPPKGVAEGSNDTIYPNAEVIKLRNGRPIGEIYQDENGWGFFHYGMDSGNDFIDSREDAIEGLRDLHQETGRSRRDTMEQGVAEGSNKNVVKSVKVGNFRHDLVDTGFGWQVRIYNGDELHDTGLSKNSEQKGLVALDDAVAYTKKQLNIKDQGVAESHQSAKTIEQIKFWYKDAADAVEMAKAAEALNVNGMYDEAIKKYKHQAQISLSKANSLKQGVAEGSKEDMSKEVKAMATGTCPHCHGPVKKKEHPTLTQYHCPKCGIRASQEKQGVAEGSEYKSRHAHKQEQDKAYADYRTKHATSSMALMTRAEFAKDQRERAAKKKQGVAEGVAETLPMDDAVKVLRQYGADHFKTTSNELHFYKQGRPFSVDLIFNNDATRSVSISQLNSATRKLKGQGVAEEQLDELSCWSGYTRVQGVPAGAPGSCKKKTNEEDVAEVKKNNKNNDHEPFDYDEWKASTVKPRKPRGYKDAEALGKALDREQSELRKRKEQGVAEGLDQPREAGKAIQSLKNLAIMKSALTMQQLSQAGRESIVTNAINAAKTLEQSYMANKQQGNAIFVRALRDEIDNFRRGAPINASFPESDNASELGDLLQGKLSKINFQQSVAEEQHSCPHCGGPMFSEMIMNEKKDACYYKVKSRYKVWPSAYASGALVKCRKSGADSWGNGGKKNESSILEGIEQVDENLHKWFKEKWVRFGPDGKIRGDCARGDDSEGKPKCLPQSKAQNLGKEGRASAAARKRREDPNPERSGKAINVNTKKKSNEGVAEGYNDIGPEYGGAYVKGRSDDARMTERLTRQAKAAAKKAGKTFSTSAEYRKWHARQKEKQGVAKDQLDEKWSQKYKDSINCSNPKGFSQRAHCQGKNK